MMKKQILAFFLTFVLLTPLTVSADNIIGDDLDYIMPGFYHVSDDGITEIDTITTGEIMCRYLVSNNAADSKNITVISSLTYGGTLVDVVFNTKAVASGESMIFENTMHVSKTENADIRIYVVRDIDVGIPLVHVMTLSGKSRNNLLKSFEIDGIAAKINHNSSRVDITLPYETELAKCIPEIEVWGEADYSLANSDFSSPVELRITAENGDMRNYIVYVKKDMPLSDNVICDFESDTPGEVPSGWILTANNSGNAKVTNDPDDSTNKVVMIEDTGDREVILKLPVSNMYYPFSVEFRINGGHYGEYKNPDADISYSMAMAGTAVGSATSICGAGFLENSKGFSWLARSRDSSGNRQDVKITTTTSPVDEWYDVKMIYRSDYMVEYYVDGEYVSTVSANAYLDKCEIFWLTTSTSRKSYMYFDDLKITHIDEESSSFSLDFEGADSDDVLADFEINLGETSIFEIDNGKALSLRGASLKRNITPTKNGASLEFDIYSDMSDADTGILNVILENNAGFTVQTDSEGNITLRNNFGASYTVNSAFESGVWHRLKFEIFKDEQSGKTIAAISTNGIMVCATAVDEEYLHMDKILLEALCGDEILLDNIVFEEN